MGKDTYTIFLALLVGILLAVFGMKLGATMTGFATTGISNASANITNVAPVVSNVVVNNGANIDLNAGTTKTVTCTGVISDGNGYDDISSASAVLYGPGVTYASGDDYNNHYTNSSCTLSAGYDTTKKNVTCTFNLEYFALPGTWTCNITATDTSSATGSSTNSANVTELIAVDVDNSINFGALAAGATSPTGVAENIRNYGNVKLDMGGNGTDMTCSTRGTIPIGNIHVGLSASADYNTEMSPMTSTIAYDDTFDLNYKTDQNLSTYSSKAYYFKVAVPEGVKGICTGTLQFTAVKDGTSGGSGGGGTV